MTERHSISARCIITWPVIIGSPVISTLWSSAEALKLSSSLPPFPGSLPLVPAADHQRCRGYKKVGGGVGKNLHYFPTAAHFGQYWEVSSSSCHFGCHILHVFRALIVIRNNELHRNWQDLTVWRSNVNDWCEPNMYDVCAEALSFAARFADSILSDFWTFMPLPSSNLMFPTATLFGLKKFPQRN